MSKVFSEARTNHLMSMSPWSFGKRVNQLGQTCEFFEHPINGDGDEILVKINNKLGYSGFMDMGGFYEDSEYLPCLVGEDIICYFEVKQPTNED